MARTIVIAWTDSRTEIVRARRTDLGERPETREVRVGVACTWLLDTDEPIDRAARYAAGHPNGRAFVYVDEPDPLGRARREVLEQCPEVGVHVTMPYRGRTLLGTVVRNDGTLTVRHFNGSPWPVSPRASDVTVLVREFDEVTDAS